MEMPAVLFKYDPDQFTITLYPPEERREEWYALATQPAVEKSSQLYVKLGKPRKPRTTGWKSQGHHFNGHVQTIAQEGGDSFDDVKMYIKREAISTGYPTRTTRWGDVVPISEADASTAECAILIDTAHRIASFLNITLKETEE